MLVITIIYVYNYTYYIYMYNIYILDYIGTPPQKKVTVHLVWFHWWDQRGLSRRLYVSDLSWKVLGCTVRVDLAWWRNAFFGKRMHSPMEPRNKNQDSHQILCAFLALGSWFLVPWGNDFSAILCCTILEPLPSTNLAPWKCQHELPYLDEELPYVEWSPPRQIILL